MFAIKRKIHPGWNLKSSNASLHLKLGFPGSSAAAAAAAAAAKSLQSCPTLCDPVDGSPPGSPVPGILQARILESANAGDIRDVGLIPGSGRSPREGHDKPLQCSCLENPLDRGAWQAMIDRMAKSWTQLKRLSMHANLKLPIVTSCL